MLNLWGFKGFIISGSFQVSFMTILCVSGVLMWEIWSGGETPYKQLRNTEVIEKVVHHNYRLEKPPNCPQHLYDIMKDTWRKVRGE